VGRATSACRTRSPSRLRRGMAPPATRGPFDTPAKIDPSRQRPDRARARAPMTASRCARGTRMRIARSLSSGAPCHAWSTTNPSRKKRPFKWFQRPSRSLQKSACRPMSFESDIPSVPKYRSELPFNLARVRRRLASNFIAVVCQKNKSVAAYRVFECEREIRVWSDWIDCRVVWSLRMNQSVESGVCTGRSRFDPRVSLWSRRGV
jgi:hypothetical protein